MRRSQVLQGIHTGGVAWRPAPTSGWRHIVHDTTTAGQASCPTPQAVTATGCSTPAVECKVRFPHLGGQVVDEDARGGRRGVHERRQRRRPILHVVLQAAVRVQVHLHGLGLGFRVRVWNLGTHDNSGSWAVGKRKTRHRPAMHDWTVMKPGGECRWHDGKPYTLTQET